MQENYDNIQMIVNWDSNPETNPGARQIIHSTVSRNLPVGDYNVYIGKVVEKIGFNQFNQLVITLRKPTQEDLSEANLNRQPLTLNQEIPSADQAESIRQPHSRAEIMQMKQSMVNAEQEMQRKTNQ